MSPTYIKELGNHIGFSGGNAYVFDVPENEYFMMVIIAIILMIVVFGVLFLIG